MPTKSNPDSLNWGEDVIFRASHEADKKERAQMAHARKEIYQMYGEYLENLRRPYPEHLLTRAGSEKGKHE